jgi:hypothetical protein
MRRRRPRASAQSSLILSRAELEDMVAALCIVASVAHLRGDHPGRDAAVDMAAEMAEDLASPLHNAPGILRDLSFYC